MLSELRFVQGAVAKKDFIPALTHFVIEDGAVRGYNGMLALCSPIPFNIACKPRADALVKAIANCTETVQLAMTAAGRLSVSEKPPSRHDAGQHATTLTAIEQDYVLQMLESQGFTYERLSSVYESRAAYNLWAFGVINETMNAQNNYEQFTHRVQELF